MAQIDLKNVTVTIKDGSSNSCTLSFGEGNLTWTERTPIKYTLNRGKLDGMGIRKDDEQLVEVRLDAILERYENGSGTDATPKEALTGTGAAADWVSVDSDGCNPYAVDLVAVYNPECSTGTSEQLTFDNFRVEEMLFDMKAGQVNITGKAISVTSVDLGTQTNL